MARRRYFRAPTKFDRGPRINMFIREQTVRLIDEDENMVGIVDIEEARRRADEAGMDLVEIAPDSEPPVCRIVDNGRYKYEQAKRDKANKAKSKTFEMKEVRLGRSMKIDPHDVEIRLKQARKFLMEGHKVLIVQNFKGREMVHRHRGVERMQNIVEKMDDIARVETPARSMGRRMTMILAPDRVKIEAIKRRKASENSAPVSKADTDAAKPSDAPEPSAPVVDEPASPAPVVEEPMPAPDVEETSPAPDVQEASPAPVVDEQG